jgi:hypothetical protein
MKWFTLLAGVTLTTLGFALGVVQDVDDWNCEHSISHAPCPFTAIPRLLFVCPSIAIGLVLIAYSLLSYQHQRRNREESQHP